MTKVNAKAGAIITTARAHMPRQSMVNSDVKSSNPTGSVFELTERVSCDASANSFQEVRKAKIAEEAMPGPASGNSTCQNACQRVQPSTCAASAISRGTCRKKPSISHIVNGTLSAT